MGDVGAAGVAVRMPVRLCPACHYSLLYLLGRALCHSELYLTSCKAGLPALENLEQVIMMKNQFTDAALVAIADKCKTARFFIASLPLCRIFSIQKCSCVEHLRSDNCGIAS